MSVSCRTPNRIRHVLVALTMVGIAACAGDRPTGPDASILAAKGGGGGGPKVNAAEPNGAPQDTTLDIRVIGSGFEDGSVVTLLLSGNSTPKLLTNSTRFVDGNNLIANITIAVDADIALYDILVSPPRGRPGVGSELFSVTGKGKPGDEVSNYTITDLGTEGSVSDINDVGLIVGGAPSGSVNRAVRWINTDGVYSTELLGDGAGEQFGSWAYAVNGSGAAVGGVRIDADFTNRAALWSGGPVQILDLPDPSHQSQASDINDAGQISGESYTSNTYRAVRWEPNGFATDLGALNLDGYESSAGWAINDLGWVGGTSTPASSEWPTKKQHGVLWIVETDGQISLLDLHPVPEIMSWVTGISDARDGKVYLAGTLEASRPVVWVVDVAFPHGVIEHVLEEVSGAQAVNAAGEVVVNLGSGPAVWTLATGLLEPLPGLSSKPRCRSSGRGINNDGTVVGSSEVFAKGQCVRHPVVWTKIIN